MQYGARGNEQVHQPGEPGCLPTPHRGAAGHWHVLHRMVLRLWGDIHQVHARHLQGAADLTGGIALHGVWRPVPAAVGWDLRVRPRQSDARTPSGCKQDESFVLHVVCQVPAKRISRLCFWATFLQGWIWGTQRAVLWALHQRGTTTCIRLGAEVLQWNSVEKSRVSWVTTGWLWASSVPSWPRKLMESWGLLQRSWLAGRGRFSSPSALPCGGHIWRTVSSTGLPGSGQTGNCWRESGEGQR